MVSKVHVIRIIGAILCDHFMQMIVGRIYTLDGGGPGRGGQMTTRLCSNLRVGVSVKCPCAPSSPCDKHMKF